MLLRSARKLPHDANLLLPQEFTTKLEITRSLAVSLATLLVRRVRRLTHRRCRVHAEGGMQKVRALDLVRARRQRRDLDIDVRSAIDVHRTIFYFHLVGRRNG